MNKICLRIVLLCLVFSCSCKQGDKENFIELSGIRIPIGAYREITDYDTSIFGGDNDMAFDVRRLSYEDDSLRLSIASEWLHPVIFDYRCEKDIRRLDVEILRRINVFLPHMKVVDTCRLNAENLVGYVILSRNSVAYQINMRLYVLNGRHDIEILGNKKLICHIFDRVTQRGWILEQNPSEIPKTWN